MTKKGEIVNSTAGGRRSQAMGAWAVDILIDGELLGIRAGSPIFVNAGAVKRRADVFAQ